VGAPGSERSGCRVQGSGFGVQGSGFRVQGSGCRMQGAGFRVQGSGFTVRGSGADLVLSSPRIYQARGPCGHARLLFSKIHDGKGANGPKNRSHDAYPVQCRDPNYYELRSERVRVCQLKKYRQLEIWPTRTWFWALHASVGRSIRPGTKADPGTL
jgi:hypothetical protein